MRSILLALGMLVGFVAPSHAVETQVTIVASTTTGVWYPLATALSSIYGKAMKDISFTAQPTQGSLDNRRLREAGERRARLPERR
jgi:TRAP-type uncharacterized transport system substrate-binding protein